MLGGGHQVCRGGQWRRCSGINVDDVDDVDGDDEFVDDSDFDDDGDDSWISFSSSSFVRGESDLPTNS